MRTALLVALSILLASCDSSTEPFVRRRAWLGAPSGGILAPDTARVGTPFTVTAFAAGSGTRDCNEPDGADVSHSAGMARVEIFVRVKRGRLICTDDLQYYPIAVSLTFAAPGVSVIRVIGTAGSGANAPLDSLERTVVVIP